MYRNSARRSIATELRQCCILKNRHSYIFRIDCVSQFSKLLIPTQNKYTVSIFKEFNVVIMDVIMD